MNLGSIIRKHRKERKMTLKTVAEKAGISEGFLSQIENNVNSPSVDTLMNICSSIGVNAGDLISQVEKQENAVLIKKEDWSEIEIPHTGFITRRFFPPENRVVIDSAILVLEPGKSIPGRKNIKNGQEVLTVLEGSVELVLKDEKFVLVERDSIHYWASSEKQVITNNGKKRTIVLWIGTI